MFAVIKFGIEVVSVETTMDAAIAAARLVVGDSEIKECSTKLLGNIFKAGNLYAMKCTNSVTTGRAYPHLISLNGDAPLLGA